MEIGDVDQRVERLLDEADAIRSLALGKPNDHKHPQLLAWFSRAKAAVADKVGESFHIFHEIKTLQFWDITSIYDDPTPEESREYFLRDVDRVTAALQAVLESEAKAPPPSSPMVQVHQHQQGASASSSSTSAATVDVQVSVSQLREAVINAADLTPEEKGAAIAAIPDSDDDPPTLENIEKLLGIATKAKSLLRPILGWALMNADKIVG